MPQTGVQSAIGVVFNKRFDLQLAFLPKYRAGDEEHPPAQLQQGPKRFEQVFLNGGELWYVTGSAQPTHVRMTPHDA
jgi:hypothetical protein